MDEYLLLFLICTLLLITIITIYKYDTVNSILSAFILLTITAYLTLYELE